MGIIFRMREIIDELKDIKLTIFDLDGVIYRGDTLIPNADKVIGELKKLSIKVVYNTNNSTATREMYVNRLNQLGISCEISDFYTSASITATEITKLKENANIFVIGEIGLQNELKAMGHQIITDKLMYNEVDFVIVGLDRKFQYDNLAFAQKCILQGRARFYATNPDATLPVDNGFLPGAGVMVKAVETCTSTKPIKTFGKPYSFGIEMILEESKIHLKNAAIFGDRLDTDILAGNNAGIKTVLVLTGVSSEQKVEEIRKQSSNSDFFNRNLIPDFVIRSLDEIFK